MFNFKVYKVYSPIFVKLSLKNNFLDLFFWDHFLFLAALIKPSNKGAGFNGLDLNSGWA